MKFGKKGKLIPWYVGPYNNVKWVGKVDYELTLLLEMSMVHPMFHMSMLMKFMGDPNSIVPFKDVSVEESLSCESAYFMSYRRCPQIEIQIHVSGVKM